jgi:hypothetical protein
MVASQVPDIGFLLEGSGRPAAARGRRRTGRLAHREGDALGAGEVGVGTGVHPVGGHRLEDVTRRLVGRVEADPLLGPEGGVVGGGQRPLELLDLDRGRRGQVADGDAQHEVVDVLVEVLADLHVGDHVVGGVVVDVVDREELSLVDGVQQFDTGVPRTWHGCPSWWVDPDG